MDWHILQQGKLQTVAPNQRQRGLVIGRRTTNSLRSFNNDAIEVPGLQYLGLLTLDN
jgi:hypothetical protein